MGGSVESVFDLAVLHDRSITDTPEVGTALQSITPTTAPIYAYYTERNLTPATGDIDIAEGIGYWYIGYDFVVS